MTDLDKVRANQNYQSIQAVQMGKALATAHDTHIFTRIAAEVHADNIIDAAGSAVGLTDSTIYGKILDLVTRLDLKDADYEPGDLALFVNPVIGNLIKKADIFDSTDIGAEKRLNGMFGMIDGVQIVRTNNMPLSSGEIPMILMTRGSCTFVEQFAGFKVTSANQGFRTNMLAENVYQAKVLGEPDQTKIAVTYCTNTSV